MAEPIDYLKTYLSIDPSDYSAMEAQIAGEPIPQRQQYYMPSYTPQVDLSQMPEMQLQPSTTVMPQADDRYQSLMDQIESLKAQIAALEAGQAPVSEMPTTQETMVEPVVTEETMPAETIDDVMAGEDLGVVTEQPATPMDDYLRDMEDREMQIDLGGNLGNIGVTLPPIQEKLNEIIPNISNQEAIQQGLEDLRNRITAGGGKLEDFQIYKPPFELPTQEAQDFVALPEGYSYTPPEGRMYASVMPKMGMRFAYGPNGERIEVTDTRQTSGGGIPSYKSISDAIEKLGPNIPGLNVTIKPPIQDTPSRLRLPVDIYPGLTEEENARYNELLRTSRIARMTPEAMAELKALESKITGEPTLGGSFVPKKLIDFKPTPPIRPFSGFGDDLPMRGVTPSTFPYGEMSDPIIPEPPIGGPVAQAPYGAIIDPIRPELIEEPVEQAPDVEPISTIQNTSPISQGVDSILFPPKASISPFPAPFNLRNQMVRQPMQFAGGGSLDASLQDLKSRLSM